jgi:hypothetical protein
MRGTSITGITNFRFRSAEYPSLLHGILGLRKKKKKATVKKINKKHKKT